MMPLGAPPPPPRRSSGSWFIVAGACAMLQGLINLAAAGWDDCMAACDKDVLSNSAKAQTEAHQAAFNLVLAILILTGGGLSFGKNRVGAGIVALAGLGNVSYFGLIAYKDPTALPLVVIALATAAFAIVAILRRTLAGRDG